MRFLTICFGDHAEENLRKYLVAKPGVKNEHMIEEDITQKIQDSFNKARQQVSLFSKSSENFRDYAEMKTVLGVVVHDKEPDLISRNFFGYIKLNEDGTVRQIIERKNPNEKISSFNEEVSGPWAKFFILKNGDTAHFGLKSNIDFDLMAERAGEKASEAWRLGKLAKEAEKDQFTGVKKEDFVNHYKLTAVTPHAWVDLEGNMVELQDLEDETSYNKMYIRTMHAAKFKEYIESIPDDTMLTIYSCHGIN